ncbi:SAF domain-containing protein [Rarobacter incanus]|uniref:Flp pilus assembly protein CpaB n=1 Tax=Rarobacter incanus TaxID=153494 RepID=A0A542SP06_9MICO|nr:SAF domain-containing protein [Rarobacter incanus]TQK76312.1 Flp pilus assembly protein CpaB [Rarobacter incanus]
MSSQQVSARPWYLRRKLLAWWLYRTRPLAIVLVAVGVIAALLPRPAPVGSIVVAARDISAGQSLTAADLEQVSVSGTLHAGWGLTARIAEVAGRSAVRDIARGNAIASDMVGDDALAPYLAGGRQAVPVAVAEPRVARSLRPGDRVDVLVPDADADGGARILARSALVVPWPDATGGGASGAQSDAVLVGVEAAEAAAIAAYGSLTSVTLVMVTAQATSD